jgi:hypothetical protein
MRHTVAAALMTALVVTFLSVAVQKDLKVLAPELGDELDEFLAGVLAGVSVAL